MTGDTDALEGNPDDGSIVVHPLSAVEAIVFGRPEQLDLLGATKAEVERPFVDAMRQAVAVLPQFQGSVDALTGRVLRLTADGARLLRDNESMRTVVVTGVVRSPQTGRIVGQLTFFGPQGLAGFASTLPSIAGGAAMQMQLARIEKALDGLKKDLGYLIRGEHLMTLAGIEVNLEVLEEVYATARRRGCVEDDQWDRVANLERSVRRLHKETSARLRVLDGALKGEGQGLVARVAELTRALHGEHSKHWVGAHVHAEIALARWEFLYLLRQAQQHPEELSELVVTLGRGLRARRQVLAELAQRIARYPSVDGTALTLVERARIWRRRRLELLRAELDDLLRVFPPNLGIAAGPGEPIALGDGSRRPPGRARFLAKAKSLPHAAAAPLGGIAARLPRDIRRVRREEGLD